MPRFQNTQAPHALYSLGVSYHDFGVIRQNGVAMFDYYKCDVVTEEQRKAIVAIAPDVEFRSASPSFAPEIHKTLICFPKAAFYRKRAA